MIVPQRKIYRSSRPMFSNTTIKIFRCIMDNPGITSNEAGVMTGISRAHTSYSIRSFYTKGLMIRENRKSTAGVTYTYSISGSNISANEMLAEEETRLSTPNITGRMEEIIKLIKESGQCTASKIANHLGVRDQNARAYIKKLLKIDMLTQVESRSKLSTYEYSIGKVSV